jgi:CO dehydrogenase nickel-insertion accessory protein CooC1
MPQVNLNMLSLQAKYFMDTQGLSEAEAIKKAYERANISEELAKELDLEQQVSTVMNKTHEQEAEEAEAQLQQQRENGFQSTVYKDPATQDGLTNEDPDRNE